MQQIYKITNLINNKTYVGQHNGNDLYYFGSGKLLKKAVKKYGKENFKREVIIQGNFNKDLLDELEVHYIQVYSPHGTSKSYNLAKGGNTNSGYSATKETRKKMSEAQKRVPKESRIRAANKRKGIKTSEEQKQKEKQTKKNLGLTRAIIQYSKENQKLNVFDSSVDAANALNLDSSGIYKCLKGIYKQCGGFIWKYKDN